MARREVEPQTELGRQLEKERENLGLTKTDWVIVLDTSVPTYLNWLSRSVEIQRVNVEKIAEVLGLSVGDVYGLMTQPPIIHAPSSTSWFGRPIDLRAVA